MRRGSWFAGEKTLEETQRSAGIRRTEERAGEEAQQMANEQKRREDYLARERAIEEASQARRAREMKPDKL